MSAATEARQDWLAGAAPGPLRGTLTVPGDKSISHRAIMLAALADGVSRIDGFLEGADTRATAAIFRQLSVRIDAPEASVRIVHGVGIDGLRGSGAPLDCGNAGTAMRLLAGLLAGQRFASTLTGDASLSQRPMRRVMAPLARMGAHVEAAADDRPPLRIHPVDGLHGIDHEADIASAQVKSAVLLAGLSAQGTTRVHEPQPTRDYTERMLAAFGYPIRFGSGWAELEGGARLRPTDVRVPADVSSAAFFIVAACVVPGSDLLLRRVGLNPRRAGLLHVLRAMGADIDIRNHGEQGGEAVADVHIRHAPLHGVEVPLQHVPDMIDEFPALFVAAACARGITAVRGAAELRVKESDRIAGMASGLRALGIRVDETPDGADIHAGALQPPAGPLDSRGDHRLAMAFAVAAQRLGPGQTLQIADVANVATSFPGFLDQAGSAGMRVAQWPTPGGHASS